MDKSSLERWRRLDAEGVLYAFADHAKEDVTFVPTQSAGTSRWHASVGGQDVELLLNGPKFWDVREKVGGGGAVDFLIHVMKVNFKAAVRLLREKGL